MHFNTALRRCSIFISILALAMLSCSGVSNISHIFAADTPTPTNTFTPSPTRTPSPTSTQTPTPSPSPTPLPSGIKAEEQTDSTTLVTDYDNHYQYILPENWRVVFTSQEDLQEAVQAEANTDPELADFVEQFENMDPDIFRLTAVNTDRKYFDRAGTPTLLTANAYEDSLAGSMPMAFVTAMIEDNILADARDTSWDVTNNGNGVEVGIVTGEDTFSLADGMSVDFERIVIAFQANGKLILLEIAATQGYEEEILASFEEMIESIQLETG